MDPARPDRRADGGRDGDGRHLGLPRFRRRLLPHVAPRAGPRPTSPRSIRIVRSTALCSRASALTFGRAEAPCVALAVGFWALLAWQTHRLWKRLFPEHADLSVLAAALVFASPLVEIQFTTVTTVFPVTLPVTLCLAAVLFLVREGQNEMRDWAIAAVSHRPRGARVRIRHRGRRGERRPPARSPPLPLGNGDRARCRPGIPGVSAFRGHQRPAKSRRGRADSAEALGRFWTTLTQWLSALGYTLAGATAGRFPSFASNGARQGTLVAALAGAVVAARRRRLGFGRRRASRRRASARGTTSPCSWPSPPGSCVIVLSGSNPLSRGSLPVALSTAGRPVRGGGDSRRHRSHRPPEIPDAVFASLAFLASWRIADSAFRVRREQHLMEEIGRRLLPLVQRSDGPRHRRGPRSADAGSSDITPKVTRRWTDADSRRVLVLPHAEATELIGTRFGCSEPRSRLPPPQAKRRGAERRDLEARLGVRSQRPGRRRGNVLPPARTLTSGRRPPDDLANTKNFVLTSSY